MLPQSRSRSRSRSKMSRLRIPVACILHCLHFILLAFYIACILYCLHFILLAFYIACILYCLHFKAAFYIHLHFMKPLQKLIGGGGLYFAIGCNGDAYTGGGTALQSRWEGGTTYFRPYSFHATLIGLMLKSRIQKWHGAPVPPPRSAAYGYGYLNIPSYVVWNKF